MLADKYDLPLSTTSAAARDAYVRGYDLALTLYPGALEAFDLALATDPGLALAHAGKAQVLMREGKAADGRAAIAVAKELGGGLSAREAGHIRFFDLAFSGQTAAAITALHEHLTDWPRDALMIATAANPNGTIGGSGRIGQKHEIAAMMDRIAPRYGNDYWFLSYYAIALSEDGRLTDARAAIERSVALNPKNAHAAHGFAHISYESGDPETGRAFLSSWLPNYPRNGSFHGHLSWHLALFELGAGNWETAQRLYRDYIALDQHSGGPPQKMTDGTAFLWRSELAGHPRDPAAWRRMYDHARRTLPRPGAGLSDLHVILAQAVMGDDTGSEARTHQIEELVREGRYPSGSYLPQLSRGLVAFERRDFPAAIDTLAPLAGQNERIGGSRAQHDLIEFTLLKAYLNAGRLEEARRLLAARRPGASGVPVVGVAALH